MTQGVQRYDARTIILHWTMALVIPLMWVGAHLIDWFPRGPLRVDARSVHITIGAALIVLTAYRIFWRRRRGTILPADGTAFGRLAVLGHRLLYLLVIAVLLLGLLNTCLRGDDIFGLFHIPRLGSYGVDERHALANRVTDQHGLLATALLALAAGHALIALWHHLVVRDDVLRRMLTDPHRG